MQEGNSQREGSGSPVLKNTDKYPDWVGGNSGNEYPDDFNITGFTDAEAGEHRYGWKSPTTKDDSKWGWKRIT